MSDAQVPGILIVRPPGTDEVRIQWTLMSGCEAIGALHIAIKVIETQIMSTSLSAPPVAVEGDAASDAPPL